MLQPHDEGGRTDRPFNTKDETRFIPHPAPELTKCMVHFSYPDARGRYRFRATRWARRWPTPRQKNKLMHLDRIPRRIPPFQVNLEPQNRIGPHDMNALPRTTPSGAYNAHLPRQRGKFSAISLNAMGLALDPSTNPCCRGEVDTSDPSKLSLPWN